MLDKILNFIEVYIGSLLFAIMVIIILAQIACRALGLPLAWSEEIARYIFVFIIYLASSKAIKEDKHLSVDILPLILGERAKNVLFIFVRIITGIFCVILLYYGSMVIIGLTTKTQFSPANGINMIIPYMAPVLGSAMMIIRAMQKINQDFKNLKLAFGNGVKS